MNDAWRMANGRSTPRPSCSEPAASGRDSSAFRAPGCPWSFRIQAACVLALILQGSIQFAAAASPLASWLAAQTNLHTWSADLTQTRTLKTLTQPLTNSGRIWFAAPNRFRWEIGSPAQTIAVRETSQMFVIYPRLKRAEKYPLDGDMRSQWKEMLSLLEAGFPRSQADLESRFKILSQSATGETHEVVLQPKSMAARRMMPQIKLAFSTNDFTLRATELQFADGSTLRNDFANTKPNPKLDDAIFEARLESGFKIVEPLKK